MAIGDRRIGTQIYGGKAPTRYTVATGGLTQAQIDKRAKRDAAEKRKASITTRAQTDPYAIAKVGDTWTSLADALGVDQGDLVKANDTQKPSAGTAVNVPPPKIPSIDPNAGYDVPRMLPGETMDEFLARVNPQPAPQPVERQSIYDYLNSLPGGNLGGGLQNIIGQGAEALRNFLLGGGDGTSFVPSGVGAGAGIGPLPAEGYVDPRGARPSDRAAYDTRVDLDPRIEARARSEAIYEAQYGVSNALADVPPPESFTDPRGARPSDRPAYDTTPTNEERLAELEALWESQKETFGRGGGIPGWIEERTGISGIDPWDMSEEELAIFLDTFDTEELNYLESHGIIVPEGGYPVTGTGGSRVPAYGQRIIPSYPTGYGGYASQKPAYSQRPSYLGLTSWSGL